MTPHLSPRRLLVIALLALLASACSTPDNSEPPAPLTEIDGAMAVDRLWSLDSGEGAAHGFVNLRPLLLADKIYTIDAEGLVQRVDAIEGVVEWSHETGLRAAAGLAGRNDSLIATSVDGDLVRLDMSEDGLVEVWRHSVKSEIRNRAVLVENQVFLRTVDGKLFAFDFNDGKVLWNVSRRVPPLSLTGTSHPAVVGDLVLGGFDNGKLVAFERKTGSAIWESSIGVPTGRSEIERLVDLDGQFLVRDGLVYVSSFQGNLAAIVISSGQILWSRDFSSFQAMDADSDALYLTDERSHVWSVDRRTGTAFWKQDALNARKLTAPRLLGDTIVVADLEGYVHFLDKRDGRLVARASTGGERYISQPLVVGDSTIVLDSAGRLTALSRPQ